APVLPPPPPAPAPPPAAVPSPRVAEEVKELPAPVVPQLREGKVTEEPSRAPPGASQRARPQASEKALPTPVPDRSAPTATPVPPRERQQAQPRPVPNQQAGAPGSAGGQAGPTMTQSESDFFLSQIVSAWVIDFDAPQFADLQIFGHYRIMADGMLAPPFGKNDPWDMTKMVENWDRIANDPRPKAQAYRTAIETFLRAMRLAQPLKMPPNAQGYPKVMELNFRVGDM
ncbi:MAG: hypothetical protein VW600_04505, partial [Ferrovibrio sp.]